MIEGGYAAPASRRLFAMVDTVEVVFTTLAEMPEPTIEPRTSKL